MAFENVFGGIDFQAGNRMAMAKQQQLQQAIGQGMAQYNAGQDRDMKRRQLEIKANEPAAMKERDLQAIQAFQAGDRSPEIMQYLQGRAAMEGQKTQYTSDPFNVGSLKATTVPNAFSQVMGGQDPRTTIDGQQLAPMTPQGIEAAIGGGISPQPPPPITPMASPEEFADSRSPEFSGMMDEYSLPETPRYTGSGIEDMTAGKGKTELGIYAAKAGIDLATASEKQKRQLAFDMEKSKAQLAQKKEAGAPVKMAEHSVMRQDIDRALGVLSSTKGVLPKTGTIGAMLDYFPETQAGQLKSYLKSVQNLVGFSKLGAMREGSPTGSSGLGALSKSEMDGLQATSGNLDIKQRGSDLDFNLKRLYNQQMDLVHGGVEHIAKVGAEKGLSQPEMESLSFRYDLKPQGAKPSREQIMQEIKRRKGQ